MAIKSSAAYVIAMNAIRKSSLSSEDILLLKSLIESLETKLIEQDTQMQILQQTINTLQNYNKNKHLLEDKKRAIY